MMLRRSPLPALRPPLRERWSVDLDSGGVMRRPASDGKVVAAAARNHLTGYDAATGAPLWDHAEPAVISEIESSDAGPVVTSPLKDGDVELSAYGWRGEPLWRVRTGIGTGPGKLRGCGDRLTAVGLPLGPSTRQVAQAYDARTGKLLLEFPCIGDAPHWVDGRYVYSEAAALGMGGLFAYDPESGRTKKLHDVGASVRVVEGGIAVFDTTSDEVRFSRLIAVDLSTGRTLWEEPGGPNYALAATEGLVASVQAIDEARVAMTLRDLSTGHALWTADSVEADAVAPVMAGDCVLGHITGERIDVYDRRDGRRIQTLKVESSLLLGGCLTPFGYVDARTRPLRFLCFSGGAS
jgi:outer membrane protein assembly factor BamB